MNIKVYSVAKDGSPEIGRQILIKDRDTGRFDMLTRLDDNREANLKKESDYKSHISSDGHFYSDGRWILPFNFDRYIYLDNLESGGLEEALTIPTESSDVTEIKDFITSLYDLRKESIKNEGEYGLGNLVFKEFRNRGYLDKLKTLLDKRQAQHLSIVDDSLEEEITKDTNAHNIDFNDLINLEVQEDGSYLLYNKQLDRKTLEHGYSVSFFRPNITKNDFDRMRRLIGNALGPIYIGIFDGEPELSYLIDDKNIAMDIAKITNQEGIWDNKNNRFEANPSYNAKKKNSWNDIYKKLKAYLKNLK